MNPHIVPLSLLVIEVLAAVASGFGLVYYFSYYNETGGWDMPSLATVMVLAIIISIFVWVGSGAKNSSCLSLMPCFIALEILALGLSIVWINVSYFENKSNLEYCGVTGVDRLTCAQEHGNTYCGAAIEQQCTRLFKGYILILSSFGVILLCQILGVVVSIKRRGQVLREEYALIEEMEEAMHRHNQEYLRKSSVHFAQQNALLHSAGGIYNSYGYSKGGSGYYTSASINGSIPAGIGNGVGPIYTNGYGTGNGVGHIYTNGNGAVHGNGVYNPSSSQKAKLIDDDVIGVDTNTHANGHTNVHANGTSYGNGYANGNGHINGTGNENGNGDYANGSHFTPGSGP